MKNLFLTLALLLSVSASAKQFDCSEDGMGPVTLTLDNNSELTIRLKTEKANSQSIIFVGTSKDAYQSTESKFTHFRPAQEPTGSFPITKVLLAKDLINGKLSNGALWIYKDGIYAEDDDITLIYSCSPSKK